MSAIPLFLNASQSKSFRRVSDLFDEVQFFAVASAATKSTVYVER